MAVVQRQFDRSHFTINDALHGAVLASFGRRTLAYLIDWAIIFACTQYVWLSFLVVLVFVLVNRRLRRPVAKSAVFVRYSLRKMDRYLASYDVEQTVRGQFRRYMRVYLYAIMYVPILIMLGVLTGSVLGFLSPNEYGALSERYVRGAMFFHPFKDVYNGFTFLAGFLGGFLYFSLFTWKWNGQTPGKRLLRIRVVRLNGKPITFGNSAERFSGYSASASLLFSGFFQFYWDRNRQTTHDKITETIVVRE